MGRARYDAGDKALVLSAEDGHVLHELQDQTPRGLAVLGAALVDDVLKQAITCEWRNDDSEEVKEARRELIGSSGALTFSKKIEFAFVSKLVGPTVRADLVRINLVRRKFAHMVRATHFKYAPVSFETDFARDNCNNLELIEGTKVDFNGQSLPINDPRERFLATCMLMFGMFVLYANLPSKLEKEVDIILKS